MTNKIETAEEKSERKLFVDGLIARGEAAKRNPDGRLPAGVTHEIVGYEADGTAIVKRVKFK